MDHFPSGVLVYFPSGATNPASAGPGQVQFATLQGFKGLEADAIVLCEARKGDQHSSEQHLYVAASRARHVLAVAEYTSTHG